MQLFTVRVWREDLGAGAEGMARRGTRGGKWRRALLSGVAIADWWRLGVRLRTVDGDGRARGHMMHARVTTFQIQPGKFDEVIRLFESLVPKSEQGFVTGLLLTDRAANKAITVTVWQTLADLNASDAYRQQQIASSQVAALLTGKPVTEVCEVAVRVP